MRDSNEIYIHPSALVDEGAKLGAGVKVWHFCHIMPQAIVGNGTSLGQNVFVASGVSLGKNCKVQNNVSLYEGVTLGDDVFLGPSCVFTNMINPRSAFPRKDSYIDTHVGDGASIGANATIVCGNTLGKYCFIGAGSVVTSHVLPYALVVGNPARQIGWMSPNGQRLIFGADAIAVCAETGDKFQLINDEQVEPVK